MELIPCVFVLFLCITVVYGLRINAGGGSLLGLQADKEDYYSSTSGPVYQYTYAGGLPLSAYSSHSFTPDGRPLVYKLPADASTKYKVTLGFAENFAPAAQHGYRLFDVFVNDELIATRADVWTLAGNKLYVPVIFEKVDVRAVNGFVTIRIVPSVENAFISLIYLDDPLQSSSPSPTNSPKFTASNTPSSSPVPLPSSSPSTTSTVTPTRSRTPTPTPTESFSLPTPTPSQKTPLSTTSKAGPAGLGIVSMATQTAKPITFPTKTPRATHSPSPSPKIPKVTWERASPDYPKKVFEAQGRILTGTQGQFLVVIGGFYNFPGHTDEVYQIRLDTPDAKWERLADMPETLTHMAQWSSGEEFCGAGGFIGPTDPGHSVNSVWCFNRLSNTWRSLPNLPADRAGGGLLMTTNFMNRREFVYASGMDREFDSFRVQIDYGTTWTLDMDTPNATWQGGLDDMHTPRNHLGAVETCGRYFFIGGQFSTNEETGNQARIDEWLADERRWSTKPPAPLPFAMGHISASVLPYKCGMIIIGGIANERELIDAVLFWEPHQNKWYVIGKYPYKVNTPVCGIIGNKIYCATGGDLYFQERMYIGTIED